MDVDPLAHHARLRRPTAVIGWIAGLHLLVTLPLAAWSLDENWWHPVAAISAWMAYWLLIGVPLTAVAAVLAARAERAATGLRHPMRAGWVGVSLGAVLAAHWLPLLLWSPLYLLQVAGSSYRTGDNVIGAVVTGIAWVFVAVGWLVARSTRRKLGARSWEGVVPGEGGRRLPRLPTPIVGGIAWAVATLPLGFLVGVLAVDEREVQVALGLWGALSLVLGFLGASWGAWAVGGLDHGREPTRYWPRVVELFGVCWVASWAVVFLVAIAPIFGSSHHEEQLITGLISAVFLVLGVTAWSYGGAARRAVVE